jgi:hypothetical protein
VCLTSVDSRGHRSIDSDVASPSILCRGLPGNHGERREL